MKIQKRAATKSIGFSQCRKNRGVYDYQDQISSLLTAFASLESTLTSI